MGSTATTKQIGYLKRLVGERGYQGDIDYDGLSGKEASSLIDEMVNLPKKEQSKGNSGSSGRANPKIEPEQLKITHGLCLKLVFNSMAEDGRIPKGQEKQFIQNVSDAMYLYCRSLKAASASFQG